MIRNLILGNQSFLEQQFNMAVIATAFANALVAQQIDPAVADVPPKSRTILNQANHAGRARALLDTQVLTQFDKVLMRAADRHVQESLRIENRLGNFFEILADRLGGDLRRPGAVRVTAHAVDNDQQYAILPLVYADTILVLLTTSNEAELRAFKLQTDTRVDFHRAANFAINACRVVASYGRRSKKSFPFTD